TAPHRWPAYRRKPRSGPRSGAFAGACRWCSWEIDAAARTIDRTFQRNRIGAANSGRVAAVRAAAVTLIFLLGSTFLRWPVQAQPVSRVAQYEVPAECPGVASFEARLSARRKAAANAD